MLLGSCARQETPELGEAVRAYDEMAKLHGYLSLLVDHRPSGQSPQI